MLTVETIGRIRREYFLKGKTIKEIARNLPVSRNTVRKVLRSGETSFAYDRDVQPRPKLGRWTTDLDELLTGNAAKAVREQLTLIRIFEELRGRGIYDNMKTAVEAIFVGKQRLYNRRFLQMCSHYLVDPVACTPASGWEKGRVENQDGLVRERFFTPRLRFKNLDELNAWLLDKCIAYAKAHRHPELAEQTIWEVFEAERPKLVPYAGRFDGFHAVPASVSKTCLVRFDNNKYSVAASAVGRPVEVQAYADRIVIRQDGRIVAEHPRSFGRGETTYDPWYYVPVLARKPGALRNGAPFKDWVLPAAIERIRRKLASIDDGNRQMVDILNAVL